MLNVLCIKRSHHSSLLTRRDKRVRVWEWQPGTGYVEAYFSPLMGHKYGVTSVKVSPQSTMLATSSIDGTTLLWNLRVGLKMWKDINGSDERASLRDFRN